MLRYVGEADAADHLRAGVERLLVDGQSLTRDLGGSANTSELTDALLHELEGVAREREAGP